ncbi:helix-turn-helix domain-containing protein [Sneathiella sp. P13V-1]|uniref:helix-turn-helix transcriptional regulator n=1 Tax=Sneathiella sp. P13V-1 TaxID=2697366 RepID=UPI00187BADA4|nr:helix-turn-helix transcriptional regulator [Sneathiella sp. P13V-1]MBE7637051.1 helix-turn-helix domain-containing protein [Sneathiella sp. P13V-1]
MRRDWIEERLKKINRRKSDLGKALSLPPSRVSEIINGRRRIQSNEISKLAKFLLLNQDEVIHHIRKETDEANLDIKKTIETVIVAGQACSKNSTYSLWPEANRYIITLPTSHNFSYSTKYAFIENTNTSKRLRIFVCITNSDFPNDPPLPDASNFTPTKTFQCMNEEDMHQIGEYKEI